MKINIVMFFKYYLKKRFHHYITRIRMVWCNRKIKEDLKVEQVILILGSGILILLGVIMFIKYGIDISYCVTWEELEQSQPPKTSGELQRGGDDIGKVEWVKPIRELKYGPDGSPIESFYIPRKPWPGPWGGTSKKVKAIKIVTATVAATAISVSVGPLLAPWVACVIYIASVLREED